MRDSSLLFNLFILQSSVLQKAHAQILCLEISLEFLQYCCLQVLYHNLLILLHFKFRKKFWQFSFIIFFNSLNFVGLAFKGLKKYANVIRTKLIS